MERVISPLPLDVNTVVWYITRMAVNPETTVRKLVSLPREWIQEIEDFRFANRIKTESEAVSVLIRRSLDAEIESRSNAT